MASFKQRIEHGFEALAGFIYNFRYLFIALMLILAVVSISQVKKLTIDMSDEGFLHPEDPVLTTYLDFRDQFGRDDLIVLAIKSPDIFSNTFLSKLAKLHKTLEEKCENLNEVKSLINARSTYGIKDGIIVEDLLEQWPETEADFSGLRQRVLSNPLYINRLISADATFTTLLIQLNTYKATPKDDELMAGFADLGSDDNAAPTVPPEFLSEQDKTKAVRLAHKIAESFQSPDFQIEIAGSPVVTAMVKK
nr:hypothetical protein [Spirochaetales bacterium]